MPGKETGAHHRWDLGSFEIFRLEPDHFALLDRQRVMIHTRTRVVHKLVTLVLPDDAFHFQRRGALHITPAISAVARVKCILHHVNLFFFNGTATTEKVLELDTLELIVDHLVEN